MFEAVRRDGVLRVAAPGARWLSSGFDGGFRRADAAYNVTVPEGFDRTDLAAFVDERRAAAGFDDSGPALLTGVSQRHARGARAGSVTAYVTTGLSNPAALPTAPDGVDAAGGAATSERADDGGDGPPRPGTVNVVVGTTHALDDGGLAGLLATAVEAKTATLSAVAGFPGTTSDAVIAGCPTSGVSEDEGRAPDPDPGAQPAAFAGSATPVGAAARACVRDALRASFESRYGDEPAPATVEEARYGTVTTRESTVVTPDG